MSADPELLRRILDEEHITATPREPTWWQWAWGRFVAWLEGIGDAIGGSSGFGPLVLTVAAVIVAVLAVLAAVAAVRLVRAVRRRADAGGPGAVAAVESLVRPDPTRWRRDAEAALAAGRPREAIRAAWLWVAWTLHGRGLGAYEPDLTNREFVERVRGDTPGWTKLPLLRTFARDADRLCYDAVDPVDSDAVALLGAADHLLGAPSSDGARA